MITPSHIGRFVSISMRTLRGAPVLAAFLLPALAGCPDPGTGGTAYGLGFEDGFAADEEYFLGYDESWLTRDAGAILYSGDEIPFVEDDTYEAGYWDGVFQAYNDGYFVAYRYAFIIGFSEGYDAAFYPDYLDFLDTDIHLEFLDGGSSDGYNDGFSEGRVFGAFDYEAVLEFDWLDAFLDWQDGLDLYFEEVDLGTGPDGPVTLYEYGTNPHDLKSGISRPLKNILRMRGPVSNKQAIEFARPLTAEQEAELGVTPNTTGRSTRDLRLDTTWLERIDAFNLIPES